MCIRDSHIIDQHKEFFEALEYVFIALHDHNGRPWLSLMLGSPGFIDSPDNKTLNLNGRVIAQDVLGLQIGGDNSVGIVGLDFSARRRNRLNGHFNERSREDVLSIAVEHSFGNCPKYIQRRSFKESDDEQVEDEQLEHFTDFDDGDVKLIEHSDTLFIASAEEQGGKLDANHRGGKPGFVNVSGKELWFNDYPGNNFFQTFGNIHNYPCVGLMFIDFETGDLLLLNGEAHIEKQVEAQSPKFLPRRFCFTLERGLRVKRAFKGQWSSVEMSPFLKDDLI